MRLISTVLHIVIILSMAAPAGVLASICAAVKKRGRILAARNSHKAVYHALFLSELTAEYLYPAVTECGIQGQITPRQVEDALKKRSGDLGSRDHIADV